MTLIKDAPFQAQRPQEERALDKSETFTIRINTDERRQLDEAKRFIQQTKDSTALKQLAWIGLRRVLHDAETHYLLDVVLNNRRRNERTGVPVDPADYAQGSTQM